MASVLAVTARRELGAAAPIISIDPGDEIKTGRVRAGFELDPLIPSFLAPLVRGAYVEGIVAGSDAESNSKTGVQGGVLIELYFPYNLIGSGQMGPGETWSLDLVWAP